jgi:hypothetical protein
MKRLRLALPLLLAGCGTLPQPFYGNPGSPEAAKLAQPPAPVLMVPTPKTALLTDDAAALYAKDVAASLAAHDVPSVAGPAVKNEWQLGISASVSGTIVTPAYAIIGPDGKTYGHQTGATAPASGWSAGDAATLNAAATADAPALTQLMSNINAQIQQANPQSLENRAPRVFVGTVTGAPGDGDTSLPLNLARNLGGPNLNVVTNAQQADFTITAAIKTSPAPQGQLQVELDWVVRDRNNRIVGQVTQLHDLDPKDITPYWGDVAAAAAQEAAQGVSTVVQNEILKKKPAP